MDHHKVIKKVRRLLNLANKTFAKQIDINPDVSTNYSDIASKYRKIIEFLKKNSTRVSPTFEIYKLSAALGLLQCKMNSFKLSPLTEETVKKNDRQLAKLAKENQHLLIATLGLEKNFKLETSLEKDEYLILKEQMYSYNCDWKKNEPNLKAAYYYNYANSLLHKSPLSTALIKKAIDFFKQSSAFYAKNERKTAKRQTDHKIAKTKKLLVIELDRLNKSAAKIKSTCIPLLPSVTTPITGHLDTPPISHATKETNMPKTSEQSNFSLIKPTDINSTQRLVAQLQSDEKLLPTKKRRIETDPITSTSAANEELLKLENETFSKIAASLEIKNSTHFHFYCSLMNSLASFIPIHSHWDRLTKLQLSKMVADFIKLLVNTPLLHQQQPLSIIEKNLNTIYQNYKNCAWNPIQAKELSEIKLTDNGLASLFISEVKAYYLSRKTLKKDIESRKIILNEIADSVKKSIDTSIVIHTIQIISSALMNLPTESEHQLLENSLKAIKAFYMSPNQDSQNWLEENNIPIKPSNPNYQNFLGKLYNLINLHSAPGVQRIEFSLSGIPKLYFFQPQAIALTKEIFLTRLKEHLLMLKTDYVMSNNQYSDICNQLTQLITMQIEQRPAIDHDVLYPLLYPKISI